MKIGKIIQLTRHNAGLRQQDLAKKIGISTRSIVNYEADGNITLDILEKIANALDVDISFFISPKMQNFAYIEAENKQCYKNNRHDDIIINIPLYSEGNNLKENIVLTMSKRELNIHFGIKEIGSLCVLKAAGNSMEPTIQEGCYVLIQEDDFEVIDGHMYAVKHKNSIFIKRLQTLPKIKLLADNDRYEPIVVEDEKQLKVIGRVLGSIFIQKY